MKIGIDVDGTITDLQRFQIDRGSKYLNKKVVNPNCMQLRNLFDVSSDVELQFWDDVVFDYASNFPVKTYVKEELDRMHDNGDEIYIITARYHTYLQDDLGRKMRKIVREWFNKNDLYFDKLVFTKENKLQRCKELGIDIMIEDKPANIKSIATYIPVIVIDQVYNRHVSGDNIYRAYSWADVESIIEEISN